MEKRNWKRLEVAIEWFNKSRTGTHRRTQKRGSPEGLSWRLRWRLVRPALTPSSRTHE